MPLNGLGRLARDVIGHAIDPAHLIHNPRRHAVQEVQVEGIDIRHHAIRAGHGTQSAGMIMGPASGYPQLCPTNEYYGRLDLPRLHGVQRT